MIADRLEFRYSPKGQLALLAVSCALIAFWWFVAATNADVVYRTAGWCGVAFFTICAFVALKRMIGGGVPFAFDLSGITFPSGSFGMVPWSEIKAYAVVTVRGHLFLALTFNDPDRILSRMSTAKRRWALANQRLGWGHWALTFSGLTPGINEAVDFIREHTSLPEGG